MNKSSESARNKGFGIFVRKALKHVLFHNGWVKLIAVLISLVLWAGLISQDNSLTREKTWQNVNVSINGADTLKRNGYIVVSNLNEKLASVSVTAAIPQKQFDTAEPSFYNLRVDLSRINGIGTQELKILSTTSNSYGKVTNTVPSSITVNVEEYFVRQRIPVSVTVTGDYQNGWYGEWYISTPNVDPELISVNGPRSIVQSISRAKVFLDPETIDWNEGTVMTTSEIRLYNRAGEEITSPLLGITTESLSIDTVLIDAYVLPTKTFRIENMIDIQGKVPPGYRITSVKTSPETITVAARGEVLEQLEELSFDRAVNLQSITETGTFQIKVQKPSDDAVLSNDTITYTVEVEKEDN